MLGVDIPWSKPSTAWLLAPQSTKLVLHLFHDIWRNHLLSDMAADVRGWCIQWQSINGVCRANFHTLAAVQKSLSRVNFSVWFIRGFQVKVCCYFMPPSCLWSSSSTFLTFPEWMLANQTHLENLIKLAHLRLSACYCACQCELVCCRQWAQLAQD